MCNAAGRRDVEVVFDLGLRPERLPLRVDWLDQSVVITTVPEHLKQQV